MSKTDDYKQYLDAFDTNHLLRLYLDMVSIKKITDEKVPARISFESQGLSARYPKTKTQIADGSKSN